jgi:hypothetical protein
MSESPETKAKLGRPRKLGTLEQEIARLPIAASTQDDLNWVSAHPAMRRKSMDSTGRIVVITPEDVARPPHGPAPSQTAANMLQHWANHPAVFFQQMISEQKKKSASGQSAGAINDDIREIKTFLDRIKSAKKLAGAEAAKDG